MVQVVVVKARLVAERVELMLVMLIMDLRQPAMV